jgi:hypothetical protein
MGTDKPRIFGRGCQIGDRNQRRHKRRYDAETRNYSGGTFATEQESVQQESGKRKCRDEDQ